MTHACVAWLVHVWYDSCKCNMTRLCVQWRMHETAHSWVIAPIHVWDASFLCDMTHPHVTWLVHTWHDSIMCDVTHTCVTWFIYLWHERIHVTRLIHKYIPTPGFFPLTKKAVAQGRNVVISSFPIHTSARIYLSLSFFFGADMGGSSLKIWEASPWKRRVMSLW